MPLNPDVDPNNDTYSGIRSAYTKYLGRNASDDEVDFHYNTSPDNYNDVIKNSSEAQTYAARPQPPATPAQQTVDQWGNAAGSSQAGIDSFWNEVTNKNRNDFSDQELSGWGVTRLSADKYRLNSTGQIVDARRDIGGANDAASWTISGGQPGQNGQAANGSSSSSASGSYSSGGPGGTPGGGPAYDPTTDNLRNQMVAALMKRSQQSLKFDENDPLIKQQGDAYAAEQERARRNYIADAAERKGPITNLQGEERLAMERAGQNTSKFVSGLMGTEVESRRNEIQNALAQLGGQLSDEQKLQLQRELGYLNDATNRFGIQTSASTAANSEALRNQQFLAQLGLQSEDQYNKWDAIRSGQIQG